LQSEQKNIRLDPLSEELGTKDVAMNKESCGVTFWPLELVIAQQSCG